MGADSKVAIIGEFTLCTYLAANRMLYKPSEKHTHASCTENEA